MMHLLKQLIFWIPCLSLCAAASGLFEQEAQNIVIETRRIVFDSFPDAFNPSLIKIDEGFLLSFRYCPDRTSQPWLSDVYVVLLNDCFDPISEPEKLNTRPKKSKTPSQSEDARFFTFRNRIFLIYNDNIDEIFFDHGKRRDMFIAELIFEKGHFQLLPPLKIFCEEKYSTSLQQKNWIPFEWDNELYFIYSVHPHEILSCNLRRGACYPLCKTAPLLDWVYGSLRGSSSAELFDGEYLAFFHSGTRMKSPASDDWKRWHYFMGAYTFSAEPPFEMKKITPQPLLAPDFYTPSYREKRVVFPGGFVVDDPYIYVAYGKDDCEIWIAILDKMALKQFLVPVKKRDPS